MTEMRVDRQFYSELVALIAERVAIDPKIHPASFIADMIQVILTISECHYPGMSEEVIVAAVKKSVDRVSKLRQMPHEELQSSKH